LVRIHTPLSVMLSTMKIRYRWIIMAAGIIMDHPMVKTIRA
jgi:hypothetical protein